MIARLLLAAGLLWAGMQGALAQATTVRTGDHPGFGRAVFDLPPGARFEAVTQGERLLLVLHGAGQVTPPDAMPRNVVSIAGGTDSATLLLRPGVAPKFTRIGDRLVVDLPNPSATPVAAAPQPTSRKRRDVVAVIPAIVPAPVPPTMPVAEPAPAMAPAAASGQSARPGPSTIAPVTPVSHEALPPPGTPVPVVAPVKAPTPEVATPAFAPLMLPADAETGAAAFLRGDTAIVVLDRRVVRPTRPGLIWLDTSTGTTLQVPLPRGAALRVSRAPSGWMIEQAATAADVPGIKSATAPDGLLFPVPRPGRVVTVTDPVGGGALLVGTSLGADAMQPAVRRTPEYALIPTWLGVAVEASADQVDLRTVQAGFLLSGGAASPPPAPMLLSRRFDLPDDPLAAQQNRLKAQLAGAAAALPRARAQARVAAARTMIGLGMAPEAQALAQLAAADDPQAAADAEISGLVAVAALLTGRNAEAAALDDSRLDGTDEIAMWRGLRDRRMGQDSPAARSLGAKIQLAQSYPAALRRLVLPDVTEAAVETGVAVEDAKLTPFARALLLERRGKAEEAIAAYDALAAGSDRLDQIRATARATELRLASGAITPGNAANLMERQSVAWRGDAREVEFRMRAAELRGSAGEWRIALDALREIGTTFPEQAEAVRARRSAVLQALLAADGGSLSPLDVVLLAADNADAVPGGEGSGALSRVLAEKLAALDLPARVIPVLQGLMKAAPAGEARATIGARVAQLLLDGNEPGAATAALEASAAPDLPGTLRGSRVLLLARSRAAQGDVEGATALLVEAGTPAAHDLRASLLGESGDWRGSLDALNDLAAAKVPAQGALDGAAQDILLRRASAAARVPDAAALRALEAFAPRMTPPRDALFRVLTAAPLALASDLPRAARELTAARALPQQIRTLAGR